MSTTVPRLLCAALLSLGAIGTAHAERYVTVNGARLSLAEIVEVERRNCGPIANGHYWYDERTAVWGYAGDPRPQGRLGDNCITRSQRRPSLSERGMLFSTHDWLR